MKTCFSSINKIILSCNFILLFAFMLCNVNLNAQVYCASGATSIDDEEIYKVTVGGVSTNPLYSNANGCVTAAPGPGSILKRYSNFKTLGVLTSFAKGATIPFTIEENECDGAIFYDFGTAIWIDYNHNGSFNDPGEKVFVEASTAFGPRNVTGSFVVPLTALCGSTTMRITVADATAGAALTSCLSYSFGETEDYLIDIGSTSTTTSVTACDSYTWSCNGLTYTASGSYTCTSINGQGCVETNTLNLTINYSTTNTTTATACYSYTWACNGVTYTASGFYTCTSLNGQGCIVTNILNLTIHTGTSSSLNVTACSSYLWTCTNQTYTASGAYTCNLLNVHGCDSTVTLNLTINPLPNVGTTVSAATICAGASTTITGTNATTYSWLPGSLSGTSIVVSPSSTTTYTVTGTVTSTGCSKTATRLITVNAPPIANAGANVTTTCLTPGATIGAAAIGGNTYAWLPSAGLSATNIAQPTANPTSTTIYTVTVTGSNGCTATSNVTVTVNKTSPTANAGSNVTTTCLTPSATIGTTAIGGNTYTWLPSAGLSATNIAQPTANPTSTTIYTVTVTGSNGCTATSNVTVTVNKTSPTANAGSNVATTCLTPSALIGTAAIGGNTYTWLPIAGLSATNIAQPTANPISTTIYTVTVTGSNGCTATSNVTVTVNKTSPTANAGSNVTTTCLTPSATIGTTAIGGNTYTWLPSAGLSATNIAQPTANPTSTTIYTVTVTGSNGCTATSNVTVTVNKTLPIANAGANVTTTCLTPSATIGTTAIGGNTYAWLPIAGLSATNIAQPTANPISTTIYTVTVTGSNGCTATSNVTVTVNKTLPIANAGANVTTTCLTPSAIIGTAAIGGNTYVWLPIAGLSATNIAQPTANPTSTTIYTVTVTGSNGCTATSNVTVTVNKTAPTANAGANVTTTCLASSAVIGTAAIGGNTYAWLPIAGLSATNIAQPTANPISTTIYTVTVTGSNGCTATSNVTVTVNKTAPTVTVTASLDTICSGGSTTLTAFGANTYVWQPGSLSGTSVNIAPLSTTVYTVTGTNSFGCVNTATKQIIVNTFPNCYCQSQALQNGDEEIYKVTIGGGSTNPLYANANGCVTQAPGPGSVLSRYSNFKTLGILSSVAQGANVSFTIEENECDGPIYYPFGTGIWIDFNHNGVFNDPGEQVFVEASAASGPRNINGTINIPMSATLGSTPVRIIVADGIAGTGINPCLQYDYGETEDFLINITATTLCSGTPSPGNTLSTISSICGSASVTFSLSNQAALNLVSGITYQWANTGGDIFGATNQTYNAIINATDNIYCKVSCSSSGLVTNSTPVSIIVYSLPLVEISSSAAGYCVGTSGVELTASGDTATYVWSPALGLSATSGAVVMASPAATTFYTVVATDAHNCSASAAIGVQVYPLPTVLTSPNSNLVCSGDSVQFTTVATGLLRDSLLTNLSGGNIASANIFNVTTTRNISIKSVKMMINTGTTAEVWYKLGGYGNANLFSSAGWTKLGATVPITAMGSGMLTNIPLTTSLSIASGQTVGLVVACNGINEYSLGSSVGSTYTSNADLSLTEGHAGDGIGGVFIFNVSPTIWNGEIVYDYLSSNAISSYGWSPAANMSDANIADPKAAAPTTTTYTLTVMDVNGCSASDSKTISINPACYCLSQALQNADEEIYKVTIGGGSTNPLYANANGCVTVAPGPGSLLSRYSNFKTLGILTNVAQGANVAFNIEENECDGPIYYPFGTGIWVDFNHNGSFTDAGEQVFAEALPAAGPRNISGFINIPISASLGATSVRIIVADGIAGTSINPCLQYEYGETEDFLINITATNICSGTPASGNTLSSLSTICGSASVTFSLSNQVALNLVSGITYQWHNSGGVITGATNQTYTAVINANETIHCIVTCGTSALSSSSTPVSITVNAIPTVEITSSAGGYCVGAQGVELSASGDTATYAWSPALGLSATSGAIVTANPLSLSTYVVVATNSNNCTASSSVSVEIYPLPTVTTTPSASTVCSGDSVQFTTSASGILTSALATTLTGGNIASANIFDVVASANISIKSVGMMINTGTSAEVWYKFGGYGNADLFSSAGWTKLGATVPITAMGTGVLTNIPLTTALNISAGQTVGLAVVSNGINEYSLGSSTGAIYTSNADLAIKEGHAGDGIGGVFFFNVAPTIWNGEIIYDKQSASAISSYGWSPPAQMNNANIANPKAASAITTTYTITVTDLNGCTATDTKIININPACYCTSQAAQSGDEEIYRVTFGGGSTNPLYANLNGCTTVAPGIGSLLSRYSNFKSLGNLTSVTQGSLVPFNIEENECDGSPLKAFGTAVWIDFNHNGSFTDLGEKVFVEAATLIGPRNISGFVNIPINALTGQTSMRIIVAEGIAGNGLNPCLQYSRGETEDFFINILPAVISCSGLPNPANTIASTNNICGSADVTFSISNQVVFNALLGLSYQWYKDNVIIAGETNQTYSATIQSSAAYHCKVTCSNGGLIGSSSAINIIVYPALNVSIASSAIGYCIGSTGVILTALGDPATYTWSPALGLSATSGLTVTATPSASTFYTVNAVDANNCVASSVVEVKKFLLPMVSMSASATNVCPGDSIQFLTTASAPGNMDDSVFTSFNGGNNAAGNVFNVTANNAITIKGFKMVINTGTSAEVWFKSGGYGNANLTSSVGWTKLGATVAITPAGGGMLTTIPITSTLSMSAGQTYGFVVVCNGVNTYGNGNSVGNISAGNADLTITEGHGGSGMGGVFNFTNSPSIWNGEIVYENPNAGIITSYAWTPSLNLTDSTSPYPAAASNITTNYQVTVTDGNGCTASDNEIIVVSPCTITLNLKCFIEGYWDGVSAMKPVLANQGEPTTASACDTLTVELRNSPSLNLAATAKTVVQQNGTALCTLTALAGSYYIVIKHRNSIETWSTNPLAINPSNPINYDFSISDAQAYGNNQAEVTPGIWALFSGDIVKDASEAIDFGDFSQLELDINNFAFGYQATDITGDGNVDLGDVPLLEQNINNFIFSNHP